MTSISQQVTELTAGMDELKTTIADEAAELQAKFDELEAKILADGEPDPDLTALIDDVHDSINSVKALSGTEPTDNTGGTTGGTTGGDTGTTGGDTGTTGGDTGTTGA